MPYVFAHHFSGSGTAEALDLYRSTFRPSPELAEPRTFLTVNAVVAATSEEAERRALPNLLHDGRAAHRPAARPPAAGRGGREGRAAAEPHRDLVAAMRARWVIGAPDEARAEVAELAATYGVDEVMVHPVAGAHVGHRTGPQSGSGGDAVLLLAARIRDSGPSV